MHVDVAHPRPHQAAQGVAVAVREAAAGAPVPAGGQVRGHAPQATEAVTVEAVQTIAWGGGGLHGELGHAHVDGGLPPANGWPGMCKY